MDSDRIEREIVIAAPPEVVWRVITDPAQVSMWLCDLADFEAKPGTYGTVAWKEHGSYDLRVEEVEQPRLFSFRWVFPAGSQPDETNSLLVEFTLTEEDGATRLRLVESGFRFVDASDAPGSAAYIADHERGWDQYLAQLVDYVADRARAAAR
jgi:uncharacterized protein YndB with AHSA1/START domain